MAASLDDAARLLRAQGLRMTPQRLAVVREIMATEGYVVRRDVAAQVQAKMAGVSEATVYRTLERLEHLGVLAHVHLESGLGYRLVDEAPHAHLTCAGCSVQIELSRGALRDLERMVERDQGFRADFTHHAIYGLCGACRTAGGVASG
jgi:Fur family transcriptional regulator, ferric uptake regulator